MNNPIPQKALSLSVVDWLSELANIIDMSETQKGICIKQAEDMGPGTDAIMRRRIVVFILESVEREYPRINDPYFRNKIAQFLCGWPGYPGQRWEDFDPHLKNTFTL